MAQSFGPYEVLERVAEGSTGTVYRAQHVELDRVAAIKELSARLFSSPGMLEQLRSEAEILAGLDDPHIVAVYDYVEESDRAWIAEQWVTGASLSAILTLHGPLTPEQSLGVIRGAMLGLAHAHDRGLAHRDIAPGNILADEQGTSMLVDFGLAAPVGDAGAKGTPAFMSPEAASGEPLGKSSDVYSAASVLYSLLAGRPPFPAADVATTLRHHRETPPPLLEGHGADLQALVRRSLDKDPAARPQDAREFLEALEEAARRRFGAAWLSRASIVGAVAGAMGASAVGGAGAGAVGAAQTVVVDAAAIRSLGAAEPASKPRRFTPKQIVGLGAAAVVVLAVAGSAAVALTRGDDVPSASAEPRPSSSATEEPTPETTFEDLSPTGKWKLKRVLVSSTFPEDTVGASDSSKWTFDPRCTDSRCTGSIESSSGSVFRYTWEASQLTIKPPGKGASVREGLCIADSTGEETPGTHFKETTRVLWGELTPSRLDADGIPQEFTGIQRIVASYSELTGDCRDLGPYRARLQVTLERR